MATKNIRIDKSFYDLLEFHRKKLKQAQPYRRVSLSEASADLTIRIEKRVYGRKNKGKKR